MTRSFSSEHYRFFMQLTKNFVKAKQPCAAGYRWFVRSRNGEGEYQQLLDDLVAEDRIEDAIWLLDQFGPTDQVRVLDFLDAKSMIFAGDLVVKHGIDVDTIVRAGRSLRTEGGIRATGSIVAGRDIKAAGGVRCEGDVLAGGDVQAGWGMEVGKTLSCRGSLNALWSIEVGQALTVDGDLHVRRDIAAGRSILCRQGIKAGGAIQSEGGIQAERGIIAGEGIYCEDFLDARWGVKAGGDITAGSAIRVGEGIETPGLISCGAGHGIYAGLAVRVDAWEISARVYARERPEQLLSGFWSGRLLN